MKKHSPNFFENLQEADTAKNNRATTFFWTVVLIATLMLGFSLTGCTYKKKFVANRPIVSSIEKDGELFIYRCENVNIDIYELSPDKAKVGDTLVFTIYKSNK